MGQRQKSILGKNQISRRQILIGGGVGAGLLIGWAMWPRSYTPNLVANKGEAILNAYIKIGEDGRVTIIVPQSESGQGVYTALPQILADELGADWRTIAVEPAPINPLYANAVIAGEAGQNQSPALFESATRWTAQKLASRETWMITGGSSSVRAFEQPLREAGAAARMLLCKAAGKIWDVDWQACDTQDGFVVRGDEKLRFGPLAASAAGYALSEPLVFREGTEHRLSGQSLPRLDLPAKIDGSANFASDVRLPDMVYAAIRQGPSGRARLAGFDKKAADGISGMIAIIDHAHWVATIATNWWAAAHALDAIKPRFTVSGTPITTASVTNALQKAMDDPGTRIVGKGDLSAVFSRQSIHIAHYSVGLAPHVTMETMNATARFEHGRLELWLATDAPVFVRDTVARSLGIAERDVILHPMLGGGSFGRMLEQEAACQAAILAMRLNRPVQLIWPRSEDIIRDNFRPPAFATLAAKLGPTGLIEGWQSKIATPSTGVEQAHRMFVGNAAISALLPGQDGADKDAVAGAEPPYAIPALAIDHHPCPIGIPTGYWRSGAHSYTAFFTECFIDELAKASGIEPLSFRMQLLSDNIRLARCLSTVAAIGGWEGGAQGTGQGIACHTMAGSHVAILAEARVDATQKVIVDRVVAVVDCGRMINPDLVRQQIESGIMFGIAAATGAPVNFVAGYPTARSFAQLDYPRLADSPEITVELIRSNEAPGGVSEIAVPPIAPAIANAIAAANGHRLRSLPLKMGAM